LARDEHRIAVKIHFEGAYSQHPRQLRRRDAAKESFDPSHKLLRVEWLGDIVVSAKLKHDHFINLLGPAAQDENRKTCGLRLLSDPPTDFEAIESRKGQIKDEQVRACFSHRSQTCLPVISSNYLESLGFKARSEKMHDALLIFDNKNLRSHTV